MPYPDTSGAALYVFPRQGGPHWRQGHAAANSSIVGTALELSGGAFKRQLELRYSGYMSRSQEVGFFNFCGLHQVQVKPDGLSGQCYWMWMEPDAKVGDADHWLRMASQQEKPDHVLKSVVALPPRLREVSELTPANGIKKEPYVWRSSSWSLMAYRPVVS
ncbi:hypothetical protein DL765_001572 [Monosporascus sp. GIB2]|nr:hypothetical protein DL765_001572 [Monosporascus sp. GIB2]